MRRNTRAAAFVAALGLLPASVHAQTPAPVRTVEQVAEVLAKQGPSEAAKLLDELPPSTAKSRLRVDISLSLGDYRQAVDAYDELIGRTKGAVPDVLGRIAMSRANALRTHEDLQVRVTACEALLAAEVEGGCLAQLLAIANDANTPFESRLGAARILVEQQTKGAPALLQSIVEQGTERSPATTADALSRLPGRISNEPLKRLLASENPDAQYLAALALARRRLPDAVAPLRAVATDPEAGAARLMAYIALAALGEKDGEKVLRETLPLLKGRDRLEAARALVARKDPAGAPMLEALLGDGSEMLRIETAELLYAAGAPRAASALRAASESTNPWVQSAAMAAAVRVGLPSTPGVRRAIAHDNPHVAAAAARAILSELRASK